MSTSSAECQTDMQEYPIFQFQQPQPIITIDAMCQTKLVTIKPNEEEPESQSVACQVNLPPTNSSSSSDPGSQGSNPARDLSVRTPLSDSVSRLPQFQIPSVKIQSDMSTQSDPRINETRKQVQATVEMLHNCSQTENEDFPKLCRKLCTKESNSQTEESQIENTSCQTGSDLIRTFNMGTQTPPKTIDSQFCQTNFTNIQLDKWCQFPLLQGEISEVDQSWESPKHLIYEPPFARTPLVTIEVNMMSKLSQTVQFSYPTITFQAPDFDPENSNPSSPKIPKSKSMPRIKTSTPTRQSSPVKFVDSSAAYQSPQQVFTGRKSASKHRLSAGTPGSSSRESRSSKYYREESDNNSGSGSSHQFTFGCYEGPKLLNKPSKKQLGIRKGKSWENYVNTVRNHYLKAEAVCRVEIVYAITAFWRVVFLMDWNEAEVCVTYICKLI